jgi:lambda family phage minor tail protein L
MTSELITSEIQKLAPSAVIELFELDATALGGDVVRFHAGTNELRANVVWQGETYNRFPVKAEGFEMATNGQLPRPRMVVSNVLGTITSLLLAYGDLLGAKVTRKRTLAKYLDAVNFDGGVNPTEDTTAEFADDIFYIDRKLSETREVVEFELAAPIDLAGVRLPRRQIIQNLCPWRYRGAECGYAGSNFFNTNDDPVGSLALDVCGKRLSSCKVRFGQNAQLPFGGFPSVGLTR